MDRYLKVYLVGMLVGGLLLALYSSFGDGTGAPAPAPGAVDPPPEDAAAELVGAGTESAPTDATPVVPAPAPPDADEDARFRVRGEVLGITTGDADQTQIDVTFLISGWPMYEHRRDATGAVDADGRFDVDLTTLFEGLDFVPSHLEVSANHPHHARAAQRVDLNGRDLATPQTFVTRLQVRRAAIVTGTVVDGRGDPIADASVGLFLMDGDEPHFGHVLPVQPAAVTRTDDGGRFRLRVGADGPHVVVAGKPGLLPRSSRVGLSVPDEAQVDPLVLEPGAVVAGIVSGFGQPIANARVSATPADDPGGWGLQLQVHDVNASWHDGDVRPGQTFTQTDAEGRYRLEGLAVGACSVGVGADLDSFDAVFPAALEAIRREVDAPREGADFDIVGVRLVVRVVTGGEPPTSGSVYLSDMGSSAVAALREDGSAHFLTAADHDHGVEVRAAGYEIRSVKLRSPKSGQHVETIALEPEAPHPTLVIVLRDEAGAPVPGAAVRIRRTDTEDGATDHRWPDGVDGVFTLDRLERGRYSIVVMPWRTSWNESGFGLEIRRDVTLPAVGEFRLELVAQKGGRLRIAARDAAGALLPAKCVIRDEAGDEQVVVFATHGDSMSMSGPGNLGTLSASLVDPPLEPGEYTIELQHEAWSRTLTATVKKTETTDVEVALEPR